MEDQGGDTEGSKEIDFVNILWFSSVTPGKFAESMGDRRVVVQGWIPSLIDAVRKYAPEINLTVAFSWKREASQTIDGVRYVALGEQVSKGRVRSEFIRAVGKCVQEIKPDLIHLHGSETIYPALPVEVWNNIPVAMSLQGIINGLYPHAMGGLIPGEMRPYVGVVRSLGIGNTIYDHADRWRRELSAAERKAFLNVKHVFGRTEWDKAWTYYLNPDAHYETVGELMRAPFYSGKRDCANVAKHSIYCSAALGGPLKGGHWLIKTVAALKRKYPDIRLRIAGGAGCAKPSGIYARLRQPQYSRYIWNLINDLGVGENVDLLPSISAEEVADELRRAEVFCLPSLGENSPNSLGEAMLLGVPSVVTDVGGISSLLENGKEGLIVPSSDPAVLASAIDRLFSDRDYARQLGTAGYEYAKARYDPEVVVGQLQHAYDSVVK